MRGIAPIIAGCLALAGCGTKPPEAACPASGAPGGVGISAVDGATDAQGRADIVATLCVGEVCRTAALAGEPNQRAALVAGFTDLPLTGSDATTVRVSLQRGGAPAGGPFDVAVHPAAVAGAQQGCPATAYVASIVVDAFGAHEAPPPQAGPTGH